MSLTTEDYKALLSEAVRQLRESPTFKMADAAKARKAAGKKVISFSVGEPAEATPDYVRTALTAMMADDAQWAAISKYSPVNGLPELKEAIVHKLHDENGIDYRPVDILVTNGGKQAIANLFAATINPGDEVLMSDPAWVSYPDIVKFHGGVPVAMRTNDDFKFTAETLRATLSEHPKAKWLILNSPSNPTGAVYSKDELAALADVILQENKARAERSEKPLMLLSDDIYEHMVYNDRLVNKPGDASAVAHNIIMADPEMKPYTVIINGVAKAFGMTGYRIGYAAGPATLIKEMGNYQGMETSGASAISQMAALAALSRENKAAREAHFVKQRESYKKRRDLVDALVNDGTSGMSFKPTDGAFYAMIDVTDMAKKLGGTHALAERMINEKGIVLVRGDDFYIEPGKQGRTFLRLSYATSEDNIRQGIVLMKELEKEILPEGVQKAASRQR